LHGEDLSEDEEELSRIRLVCVKAFLLLLLGYTLFAGKKSKTINLLWMLAIRNLDDIGTWWLNDLACGNILFSYFFKLIVNV